MRERLFQQGNGIAGTTACIQQAACAGAVLWEPVGQLGADMTLHIGHAVIGLRGGVKCLSDRKLADAHTLAHSVACRKSIPSSRKLASNDAQRAVCVTGSAWPLSANTVSPAFGSCSVSQWLLATGIRATPAPCRTRTG